jgi:hypothetical protein
VKPDAHPAIVGEETFRRVQLRLERQSAKPRPTRGGSQDAFLQGGVIVCAHCGRRLTPEKERNGKRLYKCKALDCDFAGQGINHDKLAPLVVEEALGWHALIQPNFAAVREAEHAVLPALHERLREIRAEMAETEASSVSPLRKAEALDAYDKQEAAVLGEIDQALASQGWLAVDTDTVREQIKDNPAKTNGFLKQTIRVSLASTKSSLRYGVDGKRYAFQYLTGELVKTKVTDPDGVVREHEIGVAGIPSTDEEIAEFILANPEHASADALARAKAVLAAAS